MNHPETATFAADALVADARRAVHESLALLPAWEADRVRALIADLETAVEGRTAVRMAAPAAVSVPPPAPRADDLREAADLAVVERYAALLRRKVDEEQQAETQARGPWTADGRLKTHTIPAATTPDQPSMTGGFDTSIEIPVLPAAVSGPCVAGEQQNETPEAATVHAVPLPGSNGISSCCGRPPCEFVGERVTRDPDKVTCTGPTAGVRQDGAQPCAECGHPKGAHREGDDPVTPGTCGVCDAVDPDEAHHDFARATP